MYFADFTFVSASFLVVPLVGVGTIVAAWITARRSESIRRRLPLIVVLVILAMLAASLFETIFIDPASIR